MERAVVHASGRPRKARVQAVGSGVDAQVLARGEDVHAEHRVPEERGQALQRGHVGIAGGGRSQSAEERLVAVEIELERAQSLVHRAVGHRHLVPLVGGEVGMIVERCLRGQPDGRFGVGVLPGARAVVVRHERADPAAQRPVVEGKRVAGALVDGCFPERVKDISVTQPRRAARCRPGINRLGHRQLTRGRPR